MQKPYNSQYHNHKARSKRRGIEFEFTYDEWIAWWGDDIANRGRNTGQLVMARKLDTGSYHATNVYKTTVEQNVSDRIGGYGEIKRVSSYKQTCLNRKIKEQSCL
jgi:hypothetical protein